VIDPAAYVHLRTCQFLRVAVNVLWDWRMDVENARLRHRRRIRRAVSRLYIRAVARRMAPHVDRAQVELQRVRFMDSRECRQPAGMHGPGHDRYRCRSLGWRTGRRVRGRIREERSIGVLPLDEHLGRKTIECWTLGLRAQAMQEFLRRGGLGAAPRSSLVISLVFTLAGLPRWRSAT
jgi:hypothetical protein